MDTLAVNLQQTCSILAATLQMYTTLQTYSLHDRRVNQACADLESHQVPRCTAAGGLPCTRATQARSGGSVRIRGA